MLCIIFAVVLAAGCLSAQRMDRKLIANVPFGFVAAESSFPAGAYEVYRLQTNLIVVDGGKGQKKAAMTTLPRSNGKNRGTAKLVFNKYGESYFLAEIWDSSEIGHALHMSRTEKDMALIAARQASRVTLAASVGR
jgi:hypothetical protein